MLNPKIKVLVKSAGTQNGYLHLIITRVNKMLKKREIGGTLVFDSLSCQLYVLKY